MSWLRRSALPHGHWGCRSLRTAGAVAVTLGALVLITPPALADPVPEGGGGAEVGPGGLTVWVKGAGPGDPPGAGGGLGPERYVTVLEPAVPGININDPSNVCILFGVEVGGNIVPPQTGAYLAFRIRLDTYTGEQFFQEATCVPVGTPPPPPTPAEVFWGIRDDGFPRPVIRTNPGEVGITGLETRYWYPGATSISVGLMIRGYQVTAAMDATSYQWLFGDGSDDITTSKGTPARPATQHVYETKERYGLLLDVFWDGGYTYTGWGTSGSAGLPTIVVEAGRSYPVTEIRSVQTG